MYFKGDLIITDPSYIYNEDEITFEDLDKLKTILTDSTGCGDWSCTVFGNIENPKEAAEDPDEYMTIEHKRGNFCADSGEVCVALLEEVKQVCPNFVEWAFLHPWCVAVIPNFKGDVSIIDNPLTGSKSVIGISPIINKNFFTLQTGL